MDALVNHCISSDCFTSKWFQITESEVKEMGHFLKEHLLNGTPKEKLRSLEIFRSVSEYSPAMLRYISRRVIKSIFDWALFKGTDDSPDRGLLLFNSTEISDQQASAEFLVSFLDSIEFWSKISTPESNLRTAYNKIVESQITIFKISVNKEMICHKLQELQEEINKFSVSSNDGSLIEVKINNLLFYIRSIKTICSSNPKFEGTFNDQLSSYELTLKRASQLIEFSNQTDSSSLHPLIEAIPKAPPRPDSPTEYEMIQIDEEISHEEGDHEWRSIKEEFIRLKESEKITKAKTAKLKSEIKNKDNQIIEQEFLIKESNIEINFLNKKFAKVVSEFKKYKEKVEKEIEDKDLIIEVMNNNKIQMKQVFLAKEKENDELCKKIEELQMEIGGFRDLDTTRFNTSDLRISRFSSFVEDCEPDNIKFVSQLMCVSQGVLFKNSSIEVGIRVKVEGNTGIAFIYIGNCMQKPIDYLEAFIDSPELKIELNQGIENKVINPSCQADRVLTFHYLRPFSMIPNFVLRYNRSVKTLKLPVTCSLFLNKLVNPSPAIFTAEYLYINKITTQVPTAKLQKVLIFHPAFQLIVEEPIVYIYCSEVIIELSHFVENAELLIKTNDSELCSAISELCKFQISSIEALYQN